MDDPRAKWNERYRARPPDPFPPQPSPWLAAHEHELRQRSAQSARRTPRALDCACGTGRNAIHLARLGFRVDALDISEVAIERLAATAADHGLAIDARVVDLTAGPPPAGPYDAAVVIDYLQRDLYGAVAGALAPGGIIIAETFTRVHTDELGHRFDPRFVLDPGELLASFPGLEVIAAREQIVERAGRSRAVASIVARRPA